ncbi:GTP-binding protein, partial [Paraburkholderia caribensis]|uniref:GTP-binding protein n=1 Tax=Paraburkholderia caribensis TaxID=75105 RepID=UPI002D7F563A
CTIRGDLARAVEELAARKREGKLDFDRVVIETTGLANPGPVAQTFFIDSQIADDFLLDAIITLVNAKLEIDPDFLVEDEHDHAHHGHGHGHDHGDHAHCDHDHGHCEHDHEHGHGHHHHHAHHDDKIKSFVYRNDRPFDPTKLEDFL